MWFAYMQIIGANRARENVHNTALYMCMYMYVSVMDDIHLNKSRATGLVYVHKKHVE